MHDGRSRAGQLAQNAVTRAFFVDAGAQGWSDADVMDVPPIRTTLRVATLASSLLLPACYEGPRQPGGQPWWGDDDTGDGEGADETDGADDGADDGGTGGGPAPDPGDSGADGDPDPSAGETGASGDGPAADDDGGGSDGEPPEPPPAAEDVPDNAYCAEVAAWEPAWRELEEDILVLVNEVRAQGANCGSEGSFGPTGPLAMNPALRCAARKHSKDMNDRSFFDHTNPSGESPWDRMGQAGYSYSSAGENIAGGSPDAAGTMNQWMTSDGHCANIMSPNFEEIGVGYYPGGQWGTLWTQAFGSP